MRFLGLSLAVPLLAGSVLAQTSSTVPAGFDAKEGSSYHWPAWKYAPARVQYLYNSKTLPWSTTGKLVTGMKARRDGVYATAFSAKTMTLAVEVSTVNAVSWPYPSLGDWNANHGTDRTLVIAKRSVSYPAASKPTTPPSTAYIDLKFDKPMLFKGNSLCVDIKAYSATYTFQTWYADAQGGYPLPNWGSRTSLGFGCPSTFYSYTYFSFPGSGVAIRPYGYSRVSKKALPGVLWIGNVLKTPVKIGTTGCTFYVWPPLAILGGVTDSTSLSGRIIFNLGAPPADPNLVGAHLPFQMAVVDKTYNAIWLRFSRGSDYVIGSGYKTNATSPLAVAVYNYGSTFNPDKGPTLYYSNRGVIFTLY